MAFEGYVCWDPTRAYKVMETDAEQASDEIFMAVHTDYPLMLTSPAGERDAEEFLEDFLSPNRTDVHAVVIGDSGSGKSHLVHWVELKIPDDDDLRVVSIPRTGTSLRWIVEQLIKELPASSRDEYERRLREAPASAASRDELERRLITELAIALGRVKRDDEVDRWLVDGLQSFLEDPTMRQYHVGEHGIIADLASHIQEQGGREDRDDRRRFEDADLHLDEAMSPQHDDFAASTKSFLIQLHTHRERAVELINEHLSEAVTRVLGFTGDELIQLLNEIRRQLHEDGKRLVLLIEDLARSEGIDRALLDALFERSGDPQHPLCEMRWLIAVTSGYYDRVLMDTHKTRMDLVIDMDQRSRPDGFGAQIVPFAARYLNALRVKQPALRSWYETKRAGGDEPLPNACVDCVHREDCHEAFGKVDLGDAGAVGVYPFSIGALLNMGARNGLDEHFVPRTLLRDVLRPVCDEPRSKLIADGGFPDRALLEAQHGAELPLPVRQALDQEFGADGARQQVLMELWAPQAGVATPLPEGVHRAFGLPPVTLDGAGASGPTPVALQDPDTDAGTVPASDAPAALTRDLQTIQDWASDSAMPQALTNTLRGLVFAAIYRAIDWDLSGLQRSTFASGGGGANLFSRTSVFFLRQETQPTPSKVVLVLPLDGDAQLRTAIALQGLRNFDHYGHWEFEEGLSQLVAVSESVPIWAEHVLKQFHRLADPDGEWDPVASAVEVLAVGAALSSRPAEISATNIQRLAPLFDEGPDAKELPVRSEEWRSLYQSVHRYEKEFREILRSEASVTKGGSAGAIVDGAQLMRPLRALTRAWELKAIPPARLDDESLPPRYAHLRDTHEAVRIGLAAAVEAELTARLDWLDQTRTQMPEGVGKKAVADAIMSLREAQEKHGVNVPNATVRDLPGEVEAFRGVQLDVAIQVIEDLRDVGDDIGRSIPRLAGGRRGRAMEVAEQFFPVATAFVDAVESGLKSEREGSDDAREVAAQVDRIGAALGDLEEALSAIGGAS